MDSGKLVCSNSIRQFKDSVREQTPLTLSRSGPFPIQYDNGLTRFENILLVNDNKWTSVKAFSFINKSVFSLQGTF